MPFVGADAQRSLPVKNVLQYVIVVRIRAEGMIDFLLISRVDDGDVGSVVKVVEYGGISGVSRSFSALILHIISQNAWLCQ